MNTKFEKNIIEAALNQELCGDISDRCWTYILFGGRGWVGYAKDIANRLKDPLYAGELENEDGTKFFTLSRSNSPALSANNKPLKEVVIDVSLEDLRAFLLDHPLKLRWMVDSLNHHNVIDTAAAINALMGVEVLSSRKINENPAVLRPDLLGLEVKNA